MKFLWMLLLLFSCSPQESKKDLQSSFLSFDPAHEKSSIQSFQESLYPVIMKAECSRCHQQGNVPPPFAAESIKLSHNTFLNYKLIDFQNPGESKLLLKLRDKHGLWFVPEDEREKVMQEMRTGIKKWKPHGQKVSL